MNARPCASDVVLRHTVLLSEAVRIGRRDERSTAPAPAPIAAAAPGPADAGPAVDPDALLQAALTAGREEGTRLGREEGLRLGHEEGLRKGQTQAEAAGRAALEKAIAEAAAPLQECERRLAALVASLGAQQAAWREQSEEEAVALAYELACRVLGEALVTPEGVRAQARLLLSAARHQPVAFHVHPDDLAALGLESGGPHWVGDPAVATGGCLVKGPAGALDARLESILAQCRDALLELRSRRAASSVREAP